VEEYTSVDERRRYKRLPSSLSVQYRDLKKSVELPTGTVARNVSEGGVCFNSKEFISLACRLVVEINLPALPRPIKAISKVAWIRKLSAGDEYELGNQFLEMTKEDKSHISNFINGLMSAPL